MTPRYHTGIQQGTPEWHALRAGKWTASKGAVIMGGLETQGLKDYIKDVAWGRVFGPPDAGFKGKAMERGTEMEPQGRDWYAFARDVVIVEVAMVEHGRIPNFSWSPDGLHADNVRLAIEAKCPLHKAWMEVKRTGLVPSEYRWQCKLATMVGNLERLDFVAYHPAAGGLVVPVEPLNPGEQDLVEARLYYLEKRVAEWVEILGNGVAA